jgi:hypothetical protein
LSQSGLPLASGAPHEMTDAPAQQSGQPSKAKVFISYSRKDIALAQEACASKAVDKNGKSLASAALNSFLKKCKREACEPKAVSAEGKKLSGAAKNSFMRKCEKDA